MLCQGGSVILVTNNPLMIVLPYALSILAFVSIAVYDMVRYKLSKDVSAMVNMISCLGGVFLLLLDLILHQREAYSMIYADLISVELSVLLSSGIRARQDPYLKYAMGYLLFCIVLALISVFFPEQADLRILLVRTMTPVCCVAGVWTSFVLKYRNIKLLFRPEALPLGVESDSKVLSSSIFLALVALYSILSPLDHFVSKILVQMISLLLIVLFLCLSVGSPSCRRIMVSRDAERKLRGKACGGEKPRKSEDEVEVERNLELYGRILSRMEKNRPFLDPDFSIDDLSKSIYTNKLYVSRAINSVSKMNFCQFVNHHRIEYAKMLFHENPALKVMEASDLSGFHTVASFNMAFKLNTGLTPSEWIRKNVVDCL